MSAASMSYSPELKRAIVEELESGQLSLRESAARGHTSVCRIQQWLKEFGKYQPKRDVVEVVMKSEEKKIAALEKVLAEAHLKLLVQDKIIEIASKRYKVDLIKRLVRRCQRVPNRVRSRSRSALPNGREDARCVLQTSPAGQGYQQRGGRDLAGSRSDSREGAPCGYAEAGGPASEAQRHEGGS